MYCSYSLWQLVPLFAMVATQLLFIHDVSSLNLTNAYLRHKCLASQGKYKLKSAYEENLNSAIRDLSNYTFPEGFRHTTYGENPDSATVIFQCRGDSYGSTCVSCFGTAVAGLRKRCYKNKGAIIWYDQCFLYVTASAESLRKIEYDNTFFIHNPNNVSVNIESFNKKTSDFLHELVLKADKPEVGSSNLLYYAAGEKRLWKKKLYAMVQCPKDILDCKGCLEWSIRELFKCCNSRQGARVVGTSCNLRYELYPFIRTSRSHKNSTTE